MSLAPPTLDLETNNSQPSIEIGWLSDTDLSSFLDFDTCYSDSNQEGAQLIGYCSTILSLDTEYSDSNAETVQQSEESYSKIQFAAEETQVTSAEASQPTRYSPPRIVDNKTSICDPIGSNSSQLPELLVHVSPKTDIRGNEGKSEPVLKPEQKMKDQLLFLRHKLQTGLLPVAGQPEPEKMTAMSLYIRKLENLGIPSRSLMLDTSIYKLLKKIKNLDEIPWNDKFAFKERAASLLEKWKASFDEEDPTTSSREPPISNRSIELNANPDDKEPDIAPHTQQLLENRSKTSETGLAEDCPLDVVVESGSSCKSTIDQSIRASEVPANEDPLPPPSPPFTVQHLPKPTPERLVIDLTDDDTVGIDTGSESSPQLSSSTLGAIKSKLKAKLSSPSSTNSGQPFPTSIRKDKASPKSSSARSNTKKRKGSDASVDETSPASGSNSLPETHIDNARNRRRTKRKTSSREHLANEIQWLSGSLPMVEKMIQDAEEEIEAIRIRKTRLLEENAAEMKSAERKKDNSNELKKYLIAWGAQDEKFIDEWAPS